MELGLLAILAFVFYYVFGYAPARSQREWLKLPTLPGYLAAHPECETGRGIRCFHCDMSNIGERGWTAALDSRRIFVCGRCGTRLYRSA